MPSGIEACPWRIPSKTQMRPKPTRSRRRAGGSGLAEGSGAVGAPVPAARACRSCAARWMFHATATRAMSKSTTRPWFRRADWNAETIAGLLTLRPVFMPGMLYLPSRRIGADLRLIFG